MIHYLKNHKEIEALKNIVLAHFPSDHTKKIKEKWLEFKNIPLDPRGFILCPFEKFEQGTHVEEIWKWFEEEYHIRVYDLMYRFDEFDNSFIDDKKETFSDNLQSAECVFSDITNPKEAASFDVAVILENDEKCVYSILESNLDKKMAETVRDNYILKGIMAQVVPSEYMFSTAKSFLIIENSLKTGKNIIEIQLNSQYKLISQLYAGIMISLSVYKGDTMLAQGYAKNNSVDLSETIDYIFSTLYQI